MTGFAFHRLLPAPQEKKSRGHKSGINSDQKNEPEQHVFYCYEWDTLKNHGNTFVPGHWFSVHDDIFESENWEYLGYY